MKLHFTPELQNIGGEIHVWHACVDRVDADLCYFETLLSADEKNRADRFHFPKDKNRFVVARGLLRELIGAYLQQAPSRLEFSYAEYGKPSLAAENTSNGLCFNLSYSGDVVLYAIARERNLGIDVEQMRADAARDDIAQRHFAARELSDLRSLPPEQRLEGFFNCWTRKEAYLKATGIGLRIALDSFSVTLTPGQPAQLLSGVETKWQIAARSPEEGYVAAVVYDGAPAVLQYFSADKMAREETKIG